MPSDLSWPAAHRTGTTERETDMTAFRDHHRHALLRPRRSPEPVRLRELGAGDFHVLDAVFDGLSATSRFTRFHAASPRLLPPVRDRLAAVDGHRHIAVGAFAGQQPIGIARLIGLGGGRAELAVEVVDAWQGHGVGARLVQAVVELGRAAGHNEVEAYVLADNIAMQRLLTAVFPALSRIEDGPEVTFTAPLGAGRAA
jgi:GNAT superfamily N-acetyltransferase